MGEDPKVRTARGLDVLRTLTGSQEAASDMAEFFALHGAIGQVALRVGAGEVWSRPGLSRRDRSLVVISMLAALARGGLDGLVPGEGPRQARGAPGDEREVTARKMRDVAHGGRSGVAVRRVIGHIVSLVKQI